MNEVTRILSAIEAGEPQAAARLLPLVYHELRRLAAAKLAQEKPGQKLSDEQADELLAAAVAILELIGANNGLVAAHDAAFAQLETAFPRRPAGENA